MEAFKKHSSLWKIKASGFLFFAAVTAYSADYDGPAWQELRLLGQGDAGIAKISGGPSAFYNPAGLAWSDSYSFSLINPSLGTNKNVIGSFSTLSTMTGGGGSQTLTEQFSDFLGRPLNLQGTFFPHISIPRFMIGFFDIMSTDILYRDPVYPRLEVNYRNDWGLITGGAWSYKDYFSIGAAVKWTNRTQVKEDIDSSTLLTVTSDYLTEVQKKGRTLGLNLGMQGRFPVGTGSKLMVGLAIEDVGYSRFKSIDIATPTPERQPMRVNAGLAFSLDLPASSATVFFDTKDLNHTDMSWSKKLYGGLEVATKVADFRAGLYQGYWTLGVSVAVLPFLLVDAVSYGRELDSAAGIREDRYYVVGMRMGFDLKKGSKRKQRFTLDHL